MKHYYPKFDEFLKLAERGNIVPVYRQLLADALTPVSVYNRLAMPLGFAPSKHAFLFESVVGGEQMARYSFAATDPELVVTVSQSLLTITKPGQADEVMETTDPLGKLQEIMAIYQAVHLPDLPRFTGGLVGYAGYDTVRYYENLGPGPEDDRNLPDMVFGLYRTAVVFDHISKTIKVVSNAHIKDDPGQAYTQAIEAVERTIARLRENTSQTVGEITLEGLPQKPFQSNFTRKQYCQMVESCQEYIHAGDIFQVVGSQRLTVKTTASAYDIYRALRVVNPSPYMFLLKTPQAELVGSSPEILCRVEDGVITARPLAGTRRRGKTEQEDRDLEVELLADPKERAEHIMLVDLARNDVGKVAKPSSVEISDIMSVERYSHVMHIVSDVRGVLAESKSAFDALKAVLPVGTVSGAPKIRAMEIIDEFEQTRRGPYAGAVGYIDFCGNMDMCIALRTMVVCGDNAYLQAGAGFVADSIPANEYEETLSKARALIRAIEVAEGGFED